MKLKDVIQKKLLNEIVNSIDHRVSHALPGGLVLHLREDLERNGYMLTIYRRGVEPSVQEWNIVVAHWPWDLGPLNFENAGVTENGLHYKQAWIELEA